MKSLRLLSLILLTTGTIQVNGALECTGELVTSTSFELNGNVEVPKGNNCMISGPATIHGNIKVTEGASLKIKGTVIINGNIEVKEDASLNVMCTSDCISCGCSTIDGDVKADKAHGIVIMGDAGADERTVVGGKIEIRKVGNEETGAGEVKIDNVKVGGEIIVEDGYLDILHLTSITMMAIKDITIKNNYVMNYVEEGLKLVNIKGAKNIKVESNSFDSTAALSGNEANEHIEFKKNFCAGTTQIEGNVSGKKIKVEENEFPQGINILDNKATENIEIKKNIIDSTFNVIGNDSAKKIKIEENRGETDRDDDVEINCLGNTASEGIETRNNDPPILADECAATVTCPCFQPSDLDAFVASVGSIASTLQPPLDCRNYIDCSDAPIPYVENIDIQSCGVFGDISVLNVRGFTSKYYEGCSMVQNCECRILKPDSEGGSIILSITEDEAAICEEQILDKCNELGLI